MNTKSRDASRILKIIAWCWISFPISYLALTAVALDLQPSEVFRLFVTPSYWFVSAVAFIAGLGLLRIRWYGWYAFLMSNFTIAWQNAIVLVYYSDRRQKFLAFGISILVQAVLIWLAGKEIRVPYFFPRIRWWENDPRYKLSIQTRIIRSGDQTEEADIMDISLGGCFIKTGVAFQADENVQLEFSLFEKKVVCKGRVMWRTETAVTHPKGIGVRFESLDREAAASIRRATKKLKKLSKIYNQMTREKNWKDYLEREKQSKQ